MIIDIGNIIISQIENLSFIDKYTGVVKVITMKDPSNKTGQKKIFPVACNLCNDDINNGRYKDLCPDSSKKSVLYLEDTGLRFVKKEGQRIYWKASYNLVCWLNLVKLGKQTCSYSALAIAGILKSLPLVPFNSGDTYNSISINILGQQPKTVNPFAKYSYDETVNQFLMFPYDYFVLSLDVDFMTDLRCLVLPENDPELNCIKK